MIRPLPKRTAAAGLVVGSILALVVGLGSWAIPRLPQPASTDTPAPSGTVSGAEAERAGVPAPASGMPVPSDGPDAGADEPDVFDTAAVSLEDDDGGTAMFTLANAAPGSADTGCITVTYNGDSDATVRLYGTTSGTGLEQYLDLTVTRGSFPSGTPPFDSCAGFVPDTPDYLGAGAGVIFDGSLDAYPETFDAGLVDPPGASEPWADSETHAYRFAVTVDDDNAAQGLTAGQTFTWEARGDDPPRPVPVVEPSSGPPGTVVTVGSGSDSCVPPPGAVEPRAWVWISVPETGETLADVTLPVGADGAWSGTITIPETAAGYAAVEFEASCFDAAGVAAAATATSYRTYTGVPFTVMMPTTPANSAEPASPVNGNPTYVG